MNSAWLLQSIDAQGNDKGWASEFLYTDINVERDN
jgi:hypothetical protein